MKVGQRGRDRTKRGPPSKHILFGVFLAWFKPCPHQCQHFPLQWPCLYPSLGATPTCLHTHFIKLSVQHSVLSRSGPSTKPWPPPLPLTHTHTLLLNKCEGQRLLITWVDDVCQCKPKDRYILTTPGVTGLICYNTAKLHFDQTFRFTVLNWQIYLECMQNLLNMCHMTGKINLSVTQMLLFMLVLYTTTDLVVCQRFIKVWINKMLLSCILFSPNYWSWLHMSQFCLSWLLCCWFGSSQASHLQRLIRTRELRAKAVLISLSVW